MSKGSGNAEVKGGASKLDSRYGEVVWVDDQPEGAVQQKGDDDSDASVSTAQALMDNYALLKNQQPKSLWRMHQSKVLANYGKCVWDNCPGKLTSKAKYPRSSNTHMQCKECSTHCRNDVFLCNRFIKGVPVNCHQHYHIYHHNKEFALTMVIH